VTVTDVLPGSLLFSSLTRRPVPHSPAPRRLPVPAGLSPAPSPR
jgi:hypothetical protein